MNGAELRERWRQIIAAHPERVVHPIDNALAFRAWLEELETGETVICSCGTSRRFIEAMNRKSSRKT